MTSKYIFRKYPFSLLRRFSLVALLLLLGVGASQAQWLNTNLPGSPNVQTVAVNGSTLLAGTDGSGIFRSVDSGASWIHDTTLNKFSAGGATRVSALAVSGTNIFAGTVGGVYRSINNGVTWTAVNNGLTSKQISNSGSFAFIGKNIFVATYTYIYRTPDSGNTWTAVTSFSSGGAVNCLFAFGNSLFAGGDANEGIHRSSDDGDTWIKVNKGIPAQAYVRRLAAIDTNLFASTDKGVFRSSNNGTSWSGINKGFADSTVILPLISNGKNLFAGTQKGDLYLSSNNGDSWSLVNKAGLTVSSIKLVSSIEVVGSNLFIGTIDDSKNPTSGEVWKRPISEIYTPVQLMNEVPMKFDFERNLGGTIHAGEKIWISVKQRSRINLSIFDAKGKKALTLINSEFPPGIHFTTLDGSGLSNGLYFLRLKNNGMVDTKKFIFSE